MTTLVSFLGKGRADPQTGYRTATYAFSADDQRVEAFFGTALAGHLCPDRLVLLGTAGSMWDVFFDHQTAVDDRALMTLIDAVADGTVTDALLAQHADALAARLGIPVDCVLIDYARDEAGQARILGQLADALSPGERIAIDVTHSFRHLPMLALVAARYLERVKGIDVDDIYYGALEMTEAGITPVVRLKGLLRMLDWVDALAAYDKDGDYGAFAPLLTAEGMADGTADLLARAAFMERTNNVANARRSLASARDAIAAHDGALGRLFRPALEARTAWANNSRQDHNELALARNYLERRDYLRATLMLLEGLVSREVYRRKDNHLDYAVRDEARIALGEDHDFRLLIHLRNAIAHGQPSKNKEVTRLLKDESALRNRLAQFITQFTRPTGA